MAATVPVVEVAHDAHALRVRRPHGKHHAAHAFHLPQVCAQLLVGVVVRSLGEQVQVKVGKDGWESIRIVEVPYVSVGVLRTQAIREYLRLTWEDGLEKALGMNTLKRERPGLPQDPKLSGIRHERPDGNGRFTFEMNGVRPQDVKGVGVRGTQDQFNLFPRRRRLG